MASVGDVEGRAGREVFQIPGQAELSDHRNDELIGIVIPALTSPQPPSFQRMLESEPTEKLHITN